jgi:hypothetical protein
MVDKKLINKNSKKDIKDFIGLLPLGIDAKHNFQPKYFDKFPKDYRMKFVLKPLNNLLKREWLRVVKVIMFEELHYMQNDIESINKYDQNNEYELRDIIRKSVVGWENFKTANNDSIMFELDDDGFLKDELFSLLPDTIIAELTNEINLISCLKDVEKLGLG